jgi:hypothetical protein
MWAPKPDSALQWMCTVRWKAIYTTNYDDGIERAYEQTAGPPQTPVPIASTSALVPFDRRVQVPIYYLHGRLCGPDKPQIIITESDYAEFRKRRQMMFEVLKMEFATSVFLYIGYRNQDQNWKCFWMKYDQNSTHLNCPHRLESPHPQTV